MVADRFPKILPKYNRKYKKLKKIISISFLILGLLLISGCSTTKKKSDVGAVKKLYHNTTSKYNGYYNAQEIINLTMLQIQDGHQNNYNKILSVYDYVELEDPKSITPDMDKAIEKVITVATIHELGNYVDDCYVLMGKAQYLKQDYVSAEETLQFFEEEFDPKNPYGREYTKAKLKKKTAKERKAEQKEKRKETEQKAKDREKEREDKAKQEKKAREAEAKLRKQRAKERRKRGSSRVSKKDTEPRLTSEERADKRELEKEERKQKEEEEEYAAEKKKLQEEEERKRKAQERPQGEGGVFKNRTGFYEGLYWLARTYIETERYSSAKNVFERLETTPGLHEDVANKIPAAKAHMFMRSGDMDEAIIQLDRAIELERQRDLKARYAFIKAQIYERNDNTGSAYAEYSKAKKFSPHYEMKFNAGLNELKLSYKTGKISRDKAISRLEKMSTEEKNQEYLDHVYFTMAQVKLDANEIDDAIADFNAAIDASGGNKNVKLEAYYKLAELLYDQAYYEEAKEKYDATLKLMPITDERYKNVKRLSESLTDIAKNINVVKLQDSLIRLSLMPDEDLREYAVEVIEEMNANGGGATEPDPRVKNVFTSGANRSLGLSRSSFFAYNPAALEQGKKEFDKIWGDRNLEDNWRRSLRSNASISEATGLSEDDEEEITVTDQEINEFLRNVPISDAQKTASNIKIQNALFDLGILFRERLRNYDRSINCLERLVREYPDFSKRDEALFYLYLSYQDVGDMSQATLTKNKLKSEFPDSEFTKLATDPGYAQAMKSSESNIDAYYARTYKLFENKKYQAVLERTREKANLFKDDDKYDAKFDLLVAMSNGHLEGKERYIQDLNALIKRHRNTPEEVRAKEILRFLRGDSEAFNEILYEEGQDNFKVEEEKLHYAFVVVFDLNARELQDVKIAISDFNKKYHRLDNLKITNISLNPESKSQVILIRSFSKKIPAMSYYNGVEKNRLEFSSRQNVDNPKKVEFEIFVATQKNYREVVKQKSVQQYRPFFEEFYLKDK